jgi:hypothetical protein
MTWQENQEFSKTLSFSPKKLSALQIKNLSIGGVL